MAGWIIVAAAYFVLLGFYVREDLAGSFQRATGLKMTLSSIFCLIGAWGVFSWGAEVTAGVALILCAGRRLFSSFHTARCKKI